MKLHDHGVYLVNGQLTDTAPAHVTEAEATILLMWASSRRRAPPAWKSSPCRMC